MNLGAIHEAIAEVIPDRECLVFRDQHFTWSDVRDRTRRLANLLRSHGLGCHTERSELEGWESGQAHVALYMLNGNEYLEGMVGCYKARCAPFNVNYRYIEEELLYLFDDSEWWIGWRSGIFFGIRLGSLLSDRSSVFTSAHWRGWRVGRGLKSDVVSPSLSKALRTPSQTGILHCLGSKIHLAA